MHPQTHKVTVKWAINFELKISLISMYIKYYQIIIREVYQLI